MMIKQILWCAMTILLAVHTLAARDINVSNVQLHLSSTSSESYYATVSCDISWKNSWRDDVNWDAAWVFVKYQTNEAFGNMPRFRQLQVTLCCPMVSC